ncbi:MAG: hypothetical protein QXX38_00295 [Candidatus Aenigmatarchaeota archaeon]
MIVRDLKIREIFATNSQRTIEIEIETPKGTVRSSVPIGTSRGIHEVVFLSVEDVIRKFLLIKKHFISDFIDQEDVDSTLRIIDKTPNFKEIGGNLAIAISSAFLKAFALDEGKDVFEFLLKGEVKIPKPICNVVGGWAGTGASDIQEYLLLPVHQTSFLENIKKISDCYIKIGKELKEKDRTFVFAKNLESAWVTSLSVEKTLDIIHKIANENLLRIGLDVAASQLWDGSFYVYSGSGKKYNRTEQISFLEDLVNRYKILYIEDPFHEEDLIGFSTLTHRLSPRIVCGDDIYATNLKRLKIGIEHKATNAIIIKPNQVGTISDVINVVKEAKKNKILTVVSHRSGETEDTLICHLAVGLGCDYIKLGISGERTVKINEMIRIEEKITKES